jgi:hypothetical protein
MISRQYISFVLGLFLLFTNTGFALHTHYCHVSMQTISSGIVIEFTNNVNCLNHTKEETANKCCGEHKNQENPCCEDSYLQANLDDVVMQFDFQFQTIALPVATLVLTAHFAEVPNQNVFLDYCCDAHAPPLYILFSQRLFYDC